MRWQDWLEHLGWVHDAASGTWQLNGGSITPSGSGCVDLDEADAVLRSAGYAVEPHDKRNPSCRSYVPSPDLAQAIGNQSPVLSRARMPHGVDLQGLCDAVHRAQAHVGLHDEIDWQG
ncbi:MAG: hypothetical protein AAGK04_12990 [Planctomycetota bacterium]